MWQDDECRWEGTRDGGESPTCMAYYCVDSVIGQIIAIKPKDAAVTWLAQASSNSSDLGS